MVLTDEAVAKAALTVFPPADAVTATAIALAESGGNSTAHNDVPPDDSYGLWQINMLGRLGPARRAELGLARDAELFDPAVNARAAALIRRQQGWQAWSVYLHGTYRQYMTRAQVAVDQARGNGGRPTLGRVLRLTQPMMHGEDVKAVQRLVGARPDRSGAWYGPETAERVRRWQGLHHLTADGVFGRQSAQAAGWTWTGAA